MATAKSSKTVKKTTKSAKTTAPVKPTAEVKSAPAEEVSQIKAKEIDIHQYVTVRNGFHGKLVYKSSKTGEQFVWDGFGTEQEMELLELRNVKNSAKKFFENNWFMFDEDWVVDYLGLGQYYKHAIRIEDFDKIFSLTPNEIKQTIGELSAGQKKSVIYRAKTLISDGEIDSNKAITALEDALGVELIER